MGLSGCIISLASQSAQESGRKSLPFAERAKGPEIYLRQLLAPLFRLVTAKTQTQTPTAAVEIELVRLPPSPDLPRRQRIGRLTRKKQTNLFLHLSTLIVRGVELSASET
jgi:hypothetical protein